MIRSNRPIALLVMVQAVLASAAAAAPASASAPSLEPAFGATIVSTHPDGRQAKLWLNADHTYSAESRAGRRSGGVWEIKGAKLCLSQRTPYRGLFSYCKTMPPIAIGRPWTDKAFNGERVINEVLAGRR